MSVEAGSLAGKVALVTGGSRGIGRAVATRLARDGALVVVHYATNADAAAEAVGLIEEAGGAAFAVGQPFGVAGDVDGLFAQLDGALADRGRPTHLDIVVNNAAIAIADGLEELTPEGYDRQFAVNVRAPLFVAHAAARRMGDGGRIIGISSGLTTLLRTEWLTYTMAKAALESMTALVAKELAPRGITVNAVSPGLVDTEMNGDRLRTPEGRDAAAASAEAAIGGFSTPEDMAAIVAFLASSDARWITGHVLDASGGIAIF